MRKYLRGSVLAAALAAAAAAIALPAMADIAAFNAAVRANDYKKAAAEAAATWPTLDKSRPDIPLIAREFGFAALVAGEFAAAKEYATFAINSESAEAKAAGFRASSTVLLRLSEHRLAPTEATRNVLVEALTARAGLPGLDTISYLGTDAAVGYDFEKGKWKAAQASTDLAMKMSYAGGRSYLLNHRRFTLYNAISNFMTKADQAPYDQLDKLQEAIRADMEAAASDEDAQRFVPLYWEASAWSMSISANLRSRGIERLPPDGVSKPDAAKVEPKLPSERVRRLLGQPFNATCRSRLTMSQLPPYPKSQMYDGIVGSVTLQVDVDAAGKASNPRILAAVPEEGFGRAAREGVSYMKFVPGNNWDSSCSLAETNRVVSFQFALATRTPFNGTLSDLDNWPTNPNPRPF